MGEGVPLRRVLQVDHRAVVADHVGGALDLLADREVHVGPAVGAAGRGDLRRVPARVQDVAARQIQRQAEAEGQALPHLGDALAHLLGGEQVQAPQLVVGAEITPGRALGPPGPAERHGVGLRHGRAPRSGIDPDTAARAFLTCLPPFFEAVGPHRAVPGTNLGRSGAARKSAGGQRGRRETPPHPRAGRGANDSPETSPAPRRPPLVIRPAPATVDAKPTNKECGRSERKHRCPTPRAPTPGASRSGACCPRCWRRARCLRGRRGPPIRSGSG